MGKIILLDTVLSNMIAAGEVVERISNVVKELVENSLDAKATRIDIFLEESGLKRIQVVDNGTGMDEQDALLAFERHATSKIKNEYDLFHIRSLGFRGEALPSIASVSRIELLTSQANDEVGCKVIFEDGVLVESGVGTYRKGTSVTVTHLFYHTPARFKYLKSPQTELSNVVDLVSKFSLSHPEVSFFLSNQGKLLFQTAGNGNTLDVLAKIYGIEVAKSMRRFSGRNRDYEISGFISNPIQNRSSRNYVSVFVNHRYIKSSRLTKAILEAYGQLIPLNRYPIVLINISVDPSLIDVNIHPTKQQVKFSEEDALVDLIHHIIRSKLELVEVIQPIEKSTPLKQEVQTEMDFRGDETRTIQDLKDENEYAFELKGVDSFSVEEEEKTEKRLPSLDYIGQYHGTFLLFQNNTGLYMLDQHAAAERIRYERYLNKMSSPERNDYQLLVPMKIELTASYVSMLLPHLEEVEEFGIQLKQENESTFKILNIPAWFPRGYEVQYTESVLMTFIENKDLHISSIRDELAKLLSCKHSLKANAFITKMEAVAILTDLSKCKNPYTCPHGRPIFLHLSENEIERLFKRIV
ncbi:MAG: DNA mismatch repair endonuclease MutL [Firmicutes bacterium]|nr:DNA mismatch repair endonuclease MutL [Bacillota bacterium]